MALKIRIPSMHMSEYSRERGYGQRDIRMGSAILFGCYLVLALSLCISGVAETVTLRSVADAEMRQRSPDLVWTNATIVSGTLGAPASFEIRRGLFRFELAGQIPPGATINSVTVRLVAVFRLPIGPANSTFSLRRVLSPWAEHQVTWNSRLSGVPWTTPGVLGGDAAAAASSSVFVRTLAPYVFPSTPALVADVQQWIDNPASNFGWLLHSESESVPKTARHFASRENTLPNIPQLIITYTLPSIVITTQPQSTNVNVGDNITFSVVAVGAEPLSYQWQHDGNPIAGATSDTLQLTNVQTTNAGQYRVTVSNHSGSVTSAVAQLGVQVLGAPFVDITSPATNSLFPPGADILISAVAGETNGEIRQVEFFLNTNSVGVVTASPFDILLTNVPPSTYFLQAIATDARQLTATSSVVRFTVVGPPVVSQTIQPAGTNLPLEIPITNTAIVTTEAQVTNVQFFEGNTLLGSVTDPPFTLIWNPVDERLYSLFAVATDQFGLSGTSTPMSIRFFIPESTTPKLTITEAPPNFFRSTVEQVSISGTATDNNGVSHVVYQMESGPFLGVLGRTFLAVGTANWTADIQLVPGNNAVRFRSVDLAGNSSPAVTRYYTYLLTQQVTIETDGSGTITPNLNGRPLEIGKLYQLEARPAVGHVFLEWQTSSNGYNKPLLTFIMQTNVTRLVARFAPSPFLPGSYAGVYFDENNVSPDGSGLLSFNLLHSGKFSGKLTARGVSYPIRGQFDALGSATFPVLRPALPPVVLGLQVTNNRLSGLVTNAVGANVLVSQLFGGRNDFNAKTNPAPQPGQLNFVVRRSANQSFLGSGQAAITTSGLVRLRGQWSNGSTFSLGSILIPTVEDGGNVPFYLSYRNGTEVIVGLPRFGLDQNNLSGILWWARSGTNSFLISLEVVPQN
jgi:hypothetical protein